MPSSPPPPPPPPPSPTDVIPCDVNCTSCGYNLRGASPLSLCPECGQSILASFEIYVRRNANQKFEHLRFKNRTPTFLRAAWQGAIYALCANLLALVLVFASNMRSRPPLFVNILYCVAVVLSVLALWKHGSAARAGRGILSGLIQLAAVAAIVLTLCMMMWPAKVGLVRICLGVLAVGTFLRTIYTTWWLRLEGKHWIAWPTLIAAVAQVVVYVILTEEFGRGRFWSFESIAIIPLATNVWPGILDESTTVYLRNPGLISGASLLQWIATIALILGHIAVLLADWILFILASKHSKFTLVTSPSLRDV